MAVVEMRKVILKGTETVKELRARGVKKSTAEYAVKRGWYIEGKFLNGGIRPQKEGPGNFTKLYDPYNFARRWVIIALNETNALDRLICYLDDFVQNAVTDMWEKRHKDARDWLKLATTIVCKQTKKRIAKEFMRVEREYEYHLEVDGPDWDAIRMPRKAWHGDVKITSYRPDGTATTTIYKVTQKEDAA